MHLYRKEHSSPPYDAHANLQSRTKYADPSERSLFKNRILATSIIAKGLFFGLVESLPNPSGHDGRIFRFRVLDVYGEAVTPESEPEYNSTRDAEEALHQFTKTLDAKEYYNVLMTTRLKNLRLEHVDDLALIGQALSN